MMKIKSEQIEDRLTVSIENVDDKAAIIETIEGCADGNCACSTDEYQKVETLQIIESPSGIQLKIDVKPGEVIDPNCISECLS
jgi:hypothetical protein